MKINKITKKPENLFFEAVNWYTGDNVLTIELNRPEKKNAINAAMAREIVYLLTYAKGEPEVRVVLIKAVGDVFSAGGDLAAMRGETQSTASTVPSLAESPNSSNADLNLIAFALRALNKPSVVQVEGSVFAGALLIVCNATYVYAAKEVKFSAPEIHRGLWPFMVMAGLFRIVSQRKALDWILIGEPISAKVAEEWGLINMSCELESLEKFVTQKINQLVNLPPNTVQLGLEAFMKQDDLSFEPAMDYLSGMLSETLLKGDAEEGIKAFMEKRSPNWKK